MAIDWLTMTPPDVEASYLQFYIYDVSLASENRMENNLGLSR